jgi:hypothetical protein
MLSDVTISVGSQSVTFPGLYFLIGCLIVLGLIGFIVAMTSSRRIERKTSEATDILVVQLERIGDALDRLVTQNIARAANEPSPNRQRDRFLADWAIPGRGTPPAQRAAGENGAVERAAQRPILEQPVRAATQQTAPLAQENLGGKQPEEQPVESNLSEPARSILYSMLGR